MSFLDHRALRSSAASLLVLAALSPALLSSACSNAAPTANVPAAASSGERPDASVAPTGDASAHGAHVVHYDLVLSRTEGTTSTRESFSLDLSDAAPGAVTLAKNISFGSGSRADVGTHVKARLTMQGTTPRLEVQVEASSADAAGKLRRATLQGAMPTPVGVATAVLDATDNGAQFRLTATPSAASSLDGPADPPSAAYDLDVVVTHTGPGAPPKPTALTLKLAGDAPAAAKATESVALSSSAGVGDAGATARQDVGTRVKVSGHGRGTVLELDFDLEMSALEQAAPASRIRKIISRGHLVAPFDKETVAFSGEDEGHRYSVTITPHRAKSP